MEKKDMFFVGILVITLGFLLFVMDSSITGLVTRSTYCNEEGTCYEFCQVDSDCSNSTDICCKEQEQGICTASDLCRESYLSEDEPVTGHGDEANMMALYVILFVVAVNVGFIYMISKTKSIKKSRKK